jgi:hypothetical protein
VLTKGATPLVNLGSWNYPGDDLTIGAVGNIVLFGAGFAVTLFAPRAERHEKATLWHWLATRHASVGKGIHA